MTHIVNIEDPATIQEIKKKKPEITDTACICNACRQRYSKRAKGHLVNTPVKKGEKKKLGECLLKEMGTNTQCHERLHDLTYNEGQISQCLNVQVTIQRDVKYYICHSHYNVLYNYLNIVLCDCCGVKMLQKRKTESLPSAALSYLNSIHSARLSANSIVCNACFLSAYKYGKDAQSLLVLERQLHDEMEEGKSCDVECGLSQPLYDVYLHVIDLFQNNKATLLKDLYELYCNRVDIHFGKDPHLCVKEKRTCKWLLSAIVSKFGKLVDIHVMKSDGQTIYKAGTMLVYSRVDYKQALHQALASERFGRLRHESGESVTNSEGPKNTEPNLCTMIHYLGTAINRKLNSQAKLINDSYVLNPQMVANFDYNDVLSKMDPVIWNLICVLTMNTGEETFYSRNPDLLTRT